jgi:hypothetical protein
MMEEDDKRRKKENVVEYVRKMKGKTIEPYLKPTFSLSLSPLSGVELKASHEA